MGAPVDADALAGAVRDRRRFLDRQAGRAHQVATAGLAEEAEIARLEPEVERYAKLSALLTSIGEQAQEDARGQFEALATQALQVIFGPELSFRFETGEAGGQAVLEPLIRTEHGGRVTERPVMDAQGGGLAQVAGFVMRLVMVLKARGVRKIVFLDESFGMVARSVEPRVAGFLRDVAARTGVQIVLVTHSAAYSEYADVRVRLARGPDGLTQVFEGESE